MRSGIFTDVFITNKHILARAVVFHTARHMWIKVDVFRLALRRGLLWLRAAVDGMTAFLSQVRAGLPEMRASSAK